MELYFECMYKAGTDVKFASDGAFVLLWFGLTCVLWARKSSDSRPRWSSSELSLSRPVQEFADAALDDDFVWYLHQGG